MAVLMTPPYLTFLDADGNPLSGGKVYSYEAGTTTPKATYTAEDALTPNANPVILDSAGRAVIFINGAYRFDIKDSADVLIRSVDNVSSFVSIFNTLPSQAANTVLANATASAAVPTAVPVTGGIGFSGGNLSMRINAMTAISGAVDGTADFFPLYDASANAHRRITLNEMNRVVDVQSSLLATVDSTTTIIPKDNTKPQNTEGKEYTTVAITPKSASNTIEGSVTMGVGANTNNTIIQVAVFRDSVADAIAVGLIRVNDSGDIETISFVFKDSPATTSAVTYKVRFGPNANTGYVNRNVTGQLYDGAMFSGITVREIRA